MSNIKNRDFFDVITGEAVDGEYYGKCASVFKKTSNVSMVFDSRGNYLGIRTCRGKIVNGIYKPKEGPCDFKSISDLKIWEDQECNNAFFLETKDGTFAQIDNRKTGVFP